MYPGALLAQEACSYQAMTQILSGFQGNLAVLVHSDRDCSNVISKIPDSQLHAPAKATGTRPPPTLPYRFLCTNLTEDEIVTGQGNSKLRRGIELIHEEWNPELIIVLSTCPTVMVGDNIKNVTRKAAKDLNIKVVCQITHGLSPKSPAEVVDKFFVLLSQYAERSDINRKMRVNLVGMGARPNETIEFKNILSEFGITVNSVIDNNSTLEDFKRLGQAQFNIHPGPNMLLEFDEYCRKNLGIEPIEVPLPFGLSATNEFYEAICATFNIPQDTTTAVLDKYRTAGAQGVEAFHAKYTSDRPLLVSYNIGSGRSFELRRIALEELGQKRFLDDLNIQSVLFLQGPKDEANVQRVATVLRDLGIHEEFIIFSDPGQLSHYIKPGYFACFLGEDFLANELSKIELNLLQKQALEMGYASIASNISKLEAAMNDDFHSLFKINNG